MTAAEVLAELRSLGKEPTRAIYGRHGIRNEVLGVSYADLDKLARRIKTNQDLAIALWDTGIHDARILATKIADPGEMDAQALDRWITGVTNYLEADAVAGVAARSSSAPELMERWLASDREWTSRAGWSVLGRLALNGADLPDSFFEPHLSTIEREIHDRPNRVREAMNSILIAIGCRNDALEAQALAIAKRIGKVHVDHGETNCKTPDAAEYIKKTRAYRAARAVKGKRGSS
jgi:3-methyladenine DNA glycosylase AlkD